MHCENDPVGQQWSVQKATGFIAMAPNMGQGLLARVNSVEPFASALCPNFTDIGEHIWRPITPIQLSSFRVIPKQLTQFIKSW